MLCEKMWEVKDDTKYLAWLIGEKSGDIFWVSEYSKRRKSEDKIKCSLDILRLKRLLDIQVMMLRRLMHIHIAAQCWGIWFEDNPSINDIQCYDYKLYHM